VVGLELRNPSASHVFEITRQLASARPNPAPKDYSRSGCGFADTQLGPVAIFDPFDDEAGATHLNGKVEAALMDKTKAGELFAKNHWAPACWGGSFASMSRMARGQPCCAAVSFPSRASVSAIASASRSWWS
jgi:hypothetical protein